MVLLNKARIYTEAKIVKLSKCENKCENIYDI